MRKLVKKLILSLLISFLVGGYIQTKAAISGLYDHQNVIVDLLPYYEQEELKKLCENLSSSEIRHRRERSKDCFWQFYPKLKNILIQEVWKIEIKWLIYYDILELIEVIF